MFSERTRRFQMLLVGLVAAALLLSLPATGFAAERGNRSGELASAGLLARGAGYGTEAGSKAVRELQLRLRRLGDRPGPIDGLYGPVTEAAVERFQRSHGLAIDGVVGSQTKGRLLAQRAEKLPASSPSPTQAGKPERKPPARNQRAESAPGQQQPVQPSAGAGLGRADPESSSGLPPLLVALGAALVLAALLVSLRGRRRQAIEARLNLGLVCAALLGAGVLGAAVGALFATRAAPDDSDRTTADSGALLASQSNPDEAMARTSPMTRSAGTAHRAPASTGRADAAGRSRAKRARSTAGTISSARAQAQPRTSARAIAPRPAPHDPAASDPGPVTSVPFPATADPAPAGPAPEPPPATAPARVPTPAAPAVPVRRPADDQSADAVTYTVRPGDALWPIARSQLAPDSPVDEVARKVADLGALNQNRIESGDPDVLEAGEKLRLR